jgi:hypothetical protein
MNPEEREKLAGNLSSSRIFELYLNPVQGNYDTAHLKEFHRRIFQDFPAHGIEGLNSFPKICTNLFKHEQNVQVLIPACFEKSRSRPIGSCMVNPPC